MKAKVAAVIAALFLVANPATAETDYPTKPVRLIVPFPPGTAADYVGRLLAEKWSAAWRQPVVIDNVPGAAGTIGLAKLANPRLMAIPSLFPVMRPPSSISV